MSTAVVSTTLPAKQSMVAIPAGTAEPIVNAEVTHEDFYIRDLEQMKRATNYLAWQKRQILPYLPADGDIIEIGAGIGSFSPSLSECSRTVLALEPNEYCYAQLQRAVSGDVKVRTMNIYAEHMSWHLAPEPRFDAMVLINVFEHIPDDRAVLDSVLPYMRPHAKIILQVPAFQWAFGEIDRRLGHYRRYDKQGVLRLFSGIPGHFHALRYQNAIGIFGWWLNSRRKAENQSDFQIRVFDKLILPLQSRIERLIPPPIGQSLFVVYELEGD